MMEAMKKEYSISELADALEVSASGYADHLKKEARPSPSFAWVTGNPHKT